MMRSLDRKAYARARETVAAMLCIKPDDSEAKEAQRLISQQVAPENEVDVVTIPGSDVTIEMVRISPGTFMMGSLPTEAEWEYACRAGSTTVFSFGDDRSELGDYAWFHGNSGSTTHPPGEKTPNAWGLYDMHGNVIEWVGDWHAPYSGERQSDPTGPATGIFKVLRGGSWFNYEFLCRSDYRYYYNPDNRDTLIGFRLLRTQD